MNTKRSSKSVTLLLELVAAILIFAVAAGICANVLASARVLSGEARELTTAVETVTAAAELLRAGRGAEDALALDDALEIRRQEAQGLIYYDISYISDGETLYALELVKAQEVAP